MKSRIHDTYNLTTGVAKWAEERREFGQKLLGIEDGLLETIDDMIEAKTEEMVALSGPREAVSEKLYEANLIIRGYNNIKAKFEGIIEDAKQR